MPSVGTLEVTLVGGALLGKHPRAFLCGHGGEDVLQPGDPECCVGLQTGRFGCWVDSLEVSAGGG